MRKSTLILTSSLVFFSLPGMAMAGSGAAENKPEENIEAKEQASHDLSLFSFVQRYGSRGRESRPILVTLKVKGRDGAEHFCYGRPRLRDAVLGVLSFGRGVRDGKAALDSYKPRLYRAVLRVVPEDALDGVSLRTARTPAEFTPDINVTREVCNALNE